ncbi:ABC transporter transmembrane domain-containing protein [Streptomyces sp. 4F14]|uniref:ABC transporter transmembrane domain-containing protein n=1 Tax=Streptomyces sp. 4F14 TaxID=3394380 RepID=UPI003A8A4FE1
MIDAYADPGTPDCKGGLGYLWWLTRCQPGRALAGAALASVWMVLLAAAPWMISRAVDEGLEPGDMGALVRWSIALFVVGALNAWVSIMRHRTMTRLRMDANFRTVKVVVGQAVRLGAALPRRTAAGELVTIGVGDVQTIAFSLTALGPGLGAIVVYVVVAVLLLDISPLLAVVVLTGMPVLALVVGPLMARLQGAETEYRERQRLLTARVGDLAGGLRVLNGLGGKGLFADAFRRDSARLREQGYRVGAVTSWIQALGVGLPTLFLSVVTWLVARLAAQGEITIGQLISVYGFVAVLVGPVGFLVEVGYQTSRGVVAARRVVRLLALEPDPDPASAEAPPHAAELYDPVSHVRVLPGESTAVVCARPADSAVIVDRLGRYLPSDVMWGGVRLDRVPLAEVRARILVADNEADLFAETLREMVSGRSERDVEQITRAVWAAASEDIVRGLPDGLDSAVSAQGRSLSGGQRQRVRLVRALLADPEVLLAVQPTSALDAHTEAAIAARLREGRAGRTTVVTSTSPLLLDRVDRVQYVVEGRVAAVGSHRELLERDAGYRELVARDAGEAQQVPEQGVGHRELAGRAGSAEGDVL